MYYKFLATSGQTINIPTVVSNLSEVRVDLVLSTGEVAKNVTVYKNYSGGTLSIKIPKDIDISTTISRNNYNVCVFINDIPTYSIYDSNSPTSQENIISLINAISSSIQQANSLTVKLAYTDNYSNQAISQLTNADTFLSIFKNSSLQFSLRFLNLISTGGQSNTTTGGLQLTFSPVVTQFLSLETAQAVSNFLETTRTGDINDNQEITSAGVFRFAPLGVINLATKWLNCIGQTVASSNALLNAVKSFISLNFSAPITGVGFINQVLDSNSNVELTPLEYVQILNSSRFRDYKMFFGTNPTVDMEYAGYFVIIPSVTSFTIGDKASITINNVYTLKEVIFLGIKNNQSIFVCRDSSSYAPLISHNISVTTINIYGVEDYDFSTGYVSGSPTPTIAKTYTNIVNFSVGLAVMLSEDTLAGPIIFTTVYKYGFTIDSNKNVILCNFRKSLTAVDNKSLCLDDFRYLYDEQLAFAGSMPLVQNSKNYFINNFYNVDSNIYSDSMSINTNYNAQEVYINLQPLRYGFPFAINTQILLAVFYALFTLGIVLGQPSISLFAMSVIITLELSSVSFQKNRFYFSFLKFIQENHQPLDLREKSLQIYNLYVYNG